MPNISVTIIDKQLSQVKAGLIVVPVYAKTNIATTLPPAIARTFRTKLNDLQFKGDWAAADLVIAPPSLRVAFLAAAGLGDPDAPLSRQLEGFRRSIGRILQDARRHALREVAIAIPDTKAAPALAAAALEAVEMANYRYIEHRRALKQEQRDRSLKELTIVVPKPRLSEATAAIKKSQTIMKGVSLTRTLVDQPASHASPAALVAAAEKIAEQNKQIELQVFDKAESQRRGFNAFLAVARGSVQEPYFIHMTYRPTQEAQASVALVGKGITFDSGGLSLKPSQHMTDMKIDMAGAATVLGVFSVIAKLKLPVEVHGIIATCENMPSGDAYRPGDVVEAVNGKTIEIQNTDAEGRVTLADALSYAIKQPVDAVIDLATLTGACIVALGESYAGLWSNDTALRNSLLRSARQAGEGLVGLPLPEEYRQFIQSKVADITNSAPNNPMGGAITAALFLQEFVGSKPWAHLDVAGPVYFEKPVLPYFATGATGYGVRTLLTYLQSLTEQE